jgi:hypothetical protein
MLVAFQRIKQEIGGSIIPISSSSSSSSNNREAEFTRLLRKSFSYNWEVFKYFNDETLVVYHQEASYLVHSLLPLNQTQALHPGPYDPPSDASEREKGVIYREQVYNAAWNGLTLGYPPFFVQRYCEDFHGPLEAEKKEEEYQKALKDFESFLTSHGKKGMKKIEGMEVHFGYHRAIEKDLLLYFIEEVNKKL